MEPKSSNPPNAWKTAVIAGAIGVAAFGLLGLAFAGGSGVFGNSGDDEVEIAAPARDRDEPRVREPSARVTPAPAVIENCNVYAARERDNMEIAKKGGIGAVVGAGVGAAGGAIADGGKGAGKGAGIGAIVGLTAGALYGLNEENNKSEAARAAYADCIARGGK
jgi:hypothetical protein